VYFRGGAQHQKVKRPSSGPMSALFEKPLKWFRLVRASEPQPERLGRMRGWVVFHMLSFAGKNEKLSSVIFTA
jgi:hypothetical protein